MQKYDVRPLVLDRLKTEGQELCRSNSGTQSVVVLHLALSYLLIKCYIDLCAPDFILIPKVMTYEF